MCKYNEQSPDEAFDSNVNMTGGEPVFIWRGVNLMGQFEMFNFLKRQVRRTLLSAGS